MSLEISDLLMALGVPQASGENTGEAQGNNAFAQLLAQLQGVEIAGDLPEAFVALSPADIVRLQGLDGTTLPAVETEETEQARRILEELLNALQDLFPAMIPGVSFPSPALATPSSDMEGTMMLPQDGRVARAIDSAASTISLPQGEHIPPERTEAAPFQGSYQQEAGVPTPDADGLRQVGGDEQRDAGALDAESPSFEPRAPMTQTSAMSVLSSHTVSQETGAVSGEEQEIEVDVLRRSPSPESRAMLPLRHSPLLPNTVLLRLEPPELGTLFVQVRQVNEQLMASFWADSSDIRSLLQDHFPALTQALSEQGLQVQQISLDLASGDEFAKQFAQQHSDSEANTFFQRDSEEGDGERRHPHHFASPDEPREPGNEGVDITI